MAWIDLDDVKLHLDKSSSDDDTELQSYVDEACSRIEDAKGHVDLLTVSGEIVDAAAVRGSWALLLAERPVASVTTVERLPGDGSAITVDPADPLAGTDGYRLTGGGALTVPTAGTYRVTYRAGLDPVPDHFRRAAIEFAAHIWRATQLNAGGGRPLVPGGDSYDPEVLPVNAHVGMPARVRFLLGLIGKQSRSRVFVA